MPSSIFIPTFAGVGAQILKTIAGEAATVDAEVSEGSAGTTPVESIQNPSTTDGAEETAVTTLSIDNNTPAPPAATAASMDVEVAEVGAAAAVPDSNDEVIATPMETETVTPAQDAATCTPTDPEADKNKEPSAAAIPTPTVVVPATAEESVAATAMDT